MGKSKARLIEIAGLPNSGKDTQIQVLSTYLEDFRKVKVTSIDDGFNVCPHEDIKQMDKFLWAISFTIQGIIEKTTSPVFKKNYDYIFINRGPFDLIALAYMWFSFDRMTKRELAHFTDTLLYFGMRVHHTFLLEISPEESIRRDELEEYDAVRRIHSHFSHKPVDSIERKNKKITSVGTMMTMYKSYGYALSVYKENGLRVQRIPEDTVYNNSIEILTTIFSDNLPTASVAFEDDAQMPLPGIVPESMIPE